MAHTRSMVPSAQEYYGPRACSGLSVFILGSLEVNRANASLQSIEVQSYRIEWSPLLRGRDCPSSAHSFSTMTSQEVTDSLGTLGIPPFTLRTKRSWERVSNTMDLPSFLRTGWQEESQGWGTDLALMCRLGDSF